VMATFNLLFATSLLLSELLKKFEKMPIMLLHKIYNLKFSI